MAGTYAPFRPKPLFLAVCPFHSSLGHRNFPLPVILGPGFNSFLPSVRPGRRHRCPFPCFIEMRSRMEKFPGSVTLK